MIISLFETVRLSLSISPRNLYNPSELVRKLAFCICKNKNADQLRGNTAKLISAFVFATWIRQSLYFLNPKVQASSRAVIDIGDIDISIKMSSDIDIDIENVDIDILELGVSPVVELASLTTHTLKSIYHSGTM